MNTVQIETILKQDTYAKKHLKKYAGKMNYQKLLIPLLISTIRTQVIDPASIELLFTLTNKVDVNFSTPTVYTLLSTVSLP